MSKPRIDVAAGLIMRSDGRLLLAERPEDKPWSGWWELPGGKIEAGETAMQALSRELKEELDIDVTAATPWVTYTHDYAERRVRLFFCRVTEWNGIPIGAEGQRLMWVDPAKPIHIGRLLPATEPPLRWLQIPDCYLLTSIGSAAGLPHFLTMLKNILHSGLKLVQFREPVWAASATQSEVYSAFTQVVELCRRHGAQCLVNSCHPEHWWPQADGVHFRAADARRRIAADVSASTGTISTNIAETPAAPAPLIGLSAHSADELALAPLIQADFAVLGHVLDTPSHPGRPGMGWAHFEALSRDAGLPVFAIGGQSIQTLPQARQHGAHGVAGIRYIGSANEFP